MRLVLTLAAAILCVYAAAFAAEAALVFGRPPQPLALGTVQWFYEVGVTVDRVDRAAQIGSAGNAVRAKGQFYIVHARILAPFGLRPTWNDADVRVQTFAHAGATMPPMQYRVDERAQAVLDRESGRPGPVHLVRGAEQREDLVFDLPRGIEQPAFVFVPANDPVRMLDVVFFDFWQPHRFNLRYD